MTKYWQISLRKRGKRVTLFVTTTDLMVDTDLSGETTKSLIHVARQYHRNAQNDDQDHRDLAIGAVMTYAREPEFDRTDARITRADAVPNAEPTAFIGGDRGNSLVPLWEEPEYLA